MCSSHSGPLCASRSRIDSAYSPSGAVTTSTVSASPAFVRSSPSIVSIRTYLVQQPPHIAASGRDLSAFLAFFAREILPLRLGDLELMELPPEGDTERRGVLDRQDARELYGVLALPVQPVHRPAHFRPRERIVEQVQRDVPLVGQVPEGDGDHIGRSEE